MLGAWGCGVFRNDPAEVAAAFAEVLAGPFAGVFKRIDFAVYDPTDVGNFRAFQAQFG